MMTTYVAIIGISLFIGMVIGSVMTIEAQNKAHDKLMKELYEDETV